MRKIFNVLIVFAIIAGVGFGIRDFIRKKQSSDPSTGPAVSQNSPDTPGSKNRSSTSSPDTSSGSSANVIETGESSSSPDDGTGTAGTDGYNGTDTNPGATSGSSIDEGSSNTSSDGSDSTTLDTSETETNDTISDDTTVENPSSEETSDGGAKVARRKHRDETGTDRKSDDDRQSPDTTDEKPPQKDDDPEPTHDPDAEKKAGKILEKAKAAMQKAKYTTAMAQLEKAPPEEQLRSSTADELQQLRTKATELKTVLANLNLAPSTYLTPVWVEVEMRETGTMKGLLLEETDDWVRLGRGSTKFKISKSEIDGMKRYTRKKTRKKLRASIKKEFKSFGNMKNYVIDQYYDRAKKELSNYLWRDGARTLSHAYEKQGENLYETFRDMRARTLFRNYQFFLKNNEEELAEDKKNQLLNKFPGHQLTQKAKNQAPGSGGSSLPDNPFAFGPSTSSGDGGSGSTAPESGSDSGSSSGSEGSSGGVSPPDETAKGPGGRGTNTSGGSDDSTSARKFDIQISSYNKPLQRQLQNVRRMYQNAMVHYKSASNDQKEMSRRKQENRKAQKLLMDTRDALRKVMNRKPEDQKLKDFDRHLAELYGTCYRRRKLWGVY